MSRFEISGAADRIRLPGQKQPTLDLTRRADGKPLATDPQGMADEALGRAVMQGDAEGVLRALARGADPLAKNPWQPPGSLLARGLDREDKTPGACWSSSIARRALENKEIRKGLANGGALKELWVRAARNAEKGLLGKNTALYWAVSWACALSATEPGECAGELLGAARQIIAEGLCDPDAFSCMEPKETALMSAARHQDQECLDLLAGVADWAAENERGESVVSVSLSALRDKKDDTTLDAGHEVDPQWLARFERNFDRAIERVEKSGKMSPRALGWALRSAISLHGEASAVAVRKLTRIIDPKRPLDNGETPLMAAARRVKGEQVIRDLLPVSDARATHHTSGATALSIAIEHASMEAVQALWPASDPDHAGHKGEKNRLGAFGLAFKVAHMDWTKWELVDWIGCEWATRPRESDTPRTEEMRHSALAQTFLMVPERPLPRIRALLEARELASAVKEGQRQNGQKEFAKKTPPEENSEAVLAREALRKRL